MPDHRKNPLILFYYLKNKIFKKTIRVLMKNYLSAQPIESLIPDCTNQVIYDKKVRRRIDKNIIKGYKVRQGLTTIFLLNKFFIERKISRRSYQENTINLDGA